MNKILKSISMCSLGLAFTLTLATSKSVATNYRVSPSEGLNVRATAGIGGQRIGVLTVGTVVDVQEISNGWGRIIYNGRNGWVCMEYLRLVASQKYQVTEAEGLNVRSGPGTGNSKIGAISQGTKVDVTEIRGNWGKILYSGREGWICLDYARPIGPASAPAPARPAPGTVRNFTASDRIIQFIKTSEGFVSTVSKDDLAKGIYQIGYGHCVKLGERFTSISEAQAHELLVKDLNQNYGRAINAFLQNNHITANQQQFDALLSFTYNLGTAWMTSDSDWTDIRDLILKAPGRNLSNVDKVAFVAACLQRHHCFGCIPGLLFRRMDEMNIFFEGDYTCHQSKSANHGYAIPGCIRNQW